MDYTETKERRISTYQGVIINVALDQARLHNGSRVLREVVEHPGGVAVLPLDQDGYVYCVKQFRYPFQCHLLEIPAGKLEPGEDPRLCAERELSEETGFTAGRFVSLGEFYSSPGFSSEILHLYLALDLQEGEAHPDQDEFLDRIRIPLSELKERVLRGELHDGKTVVAVLKAAALLEENRV